MKLTIVNDLSIQHLIFKSEKKGILGKKKVEVSRENRDKLVNAKKQNRTKVVVMAKKYNICIAIATKSS